MRATALYALGGYAKRGRRYHWPFSKVKGYGEIGHLRCRQHELPLASGNGLKLW